MVLTCDRLPRDLDALEDRLRERFEAGLLTDILPPDGATRLTVLRKRVQHDDVAVEDDAVLELLAERIPTNIRQLEGALIRVVAFALAHRQAAGHRPRRGGPRRPLSRDAGLAGAAASAPPRRSRRARSRTSSARRSVSPATSSLSSSRAARLAWPRQVAMYLARENTDATLPSIGHSFGGRNHTTVMHACRRTADRIAGDPDAFEAVRSLTTRLRGTGADRRD